MAEVEKKIKKKRKCVYTPARKTAFEKMEEKT